MPAKQSLLGELLVQRGVLTRAQIVEFLERQKTSEHRLASECFFSGAAAQHDLVTALSTQAGVPGVNLSRMVVPVGVLELVPEEVAVSHNLLPVGADGQAIFVAAADPADEAVAQVVAQLQRSAPRRRVFPCVALHGLLRHTILAAYQARRVGEAAYRGADAEGFGGAPPDLIYVDDIGSVTESARPDNELLIDPLGSEVDGDVEVRTGVRNLSARTTGRRSATVKAGPLRVLVAAAVEALRELIRGVLESKGLQVQESWRGLDALTRVKRESPDLIIVDALLPELHGFDVARKLKQSGRFDEIPIIVTSSIHNGWRIAQDLKDSLGVEAFLAQPFKITQLWGTVQDVLMSGALDESRRFKAPSMAVSARGSYHAGIEAYRAGDIDAAIEQFQEGVRIDPLSSKLFFQLGVLYLKKPGMVYQAMRALEDAIERDPRLFPALSTLAKLYEGKGFRNKAMDLWEQALHASPDDATRARIRQRIIALIG